MEITKASFRMLCAMGAVALGVTPALAGAAVIFRKVPPLTVEQTPAYPRNLARYHVGAKVEAAPSGHSIANLQLNSNSQDQNAAEAALLCDDPTVGYALPVGKITLLVSLPQIEHVGNISFQNAGAKGEVTVAISNAKLPENSPQWRTALQRPLSTDAVEAAIGSAEAKYVRLTFNITEPGRIYGFGIYATHRISDFTNPRSRIAPRDQSDSFALISYALTDIHARARALYVTSGGDLKKAHNLIDGQTTTRYVFAAEDGNPAAIIDLGGPSTLRRVSAVYSPQPGKIEFYVLENLPGAPPVRANEAEAEGNALGGAQSAPETVRMDDDAFASMKSVGAVTDDGSRGQAAIDFPATSGRYLMVRWTPARQGGSFSIAEVSAFGLKADSNTILAANTRLPSEETESGRSDGKTVLDGKTMLDGKQMIDGKTMLDGKQMIDSKEIPVEAPALYLPHPPPFTFVPVIIPASP